MKKLVATLVLSAMAVAAPTAGMAVSVTYAHGNGTQNATQWYGNGAYLDGVLRSAAGSPVYYEGLVAIGNCSDVNDGRYTGNVTSTSYMGAGGQVTSGPLFWPCYLQGAKARVCRDINNLPDTCGGWSALIPR